MAEIISFNIIKGGSAKTISALNTAYGLAHLHNKKVLIIDLDPQGNVCTALGIEDKVKEKDVREFIFGEATFDDVVISHEGVDIIPSSLSLSTIEFELAKSGKLDINLIKSAIDGIKNKYDYVILDTPPSSGFLQALILTATDTIWLPAKLDELGVKGIEQALGFLIDGGFKDKVKGILPTMVNKRTVAAKNTWNKLNDLTKFTPIELVSLEDSISNSTIIPKGLGGLPTIITKPLSPVGEAYSKFVEKYIL